jgi:hypothetical protein
MIVRDDSKGWQQEIILIIVRVVVKRDSFG